MIIMIPAYKPDHSLVALCTELANEAQSRGTCIELLVIDDGSGAEFAPIFDRVRNTARTPVTVLELPENRGKGGALRAGFEWVQLHHPEQSVVTADADGQHLPSDILTVGAATESYKLVGTSAIVLGVRTIEDQKTEGRKIPLRSRVGNAATVGFFALATGRKIADTQTGLRGFTPDVLDWVISVPGNRYEYEFSTLLRVTRTDIVLDQVPIVKVYEPGNPTSHFRPVRDSLRIYAPLFIFLAASFAGFITDTLALLFLVSCGLNIIAAVVGARIFSASINFAINRWAMHDGGKRPSTRSSVVRYSVLALMLLALNAGLLEALTWAGIHLLVAKILVELTLIPVSFAVQKRWVFSAASSVQAKPKKLTQQPEHQRIKVSVYPL